MYYMPLNSAGKFVAGTHVRSEPERPRKRNETYGNCIEDLMGRLLALYQDGIYNFSEKKFNEYEKDIRKVILATKYENTLHISESKNLDIMVVGISQAINKYLPKLDFEAIAEDVEKEIRKMGVMK